MIALTPVTSSNIAAVGFDEAIGVLAVQFNSAEAPHLYRDVPAAEVAAMKAAPSIGSHFAKRIRGYFDHEAPDGTVTPATKARDPINP